VIKLKQKLHKERF